MRTFSLVTSVLLASLALVPEADAGVLKAWRALRRGAERSMCWQRQLNPHIEATRRLMEAFYGTHEALERVGLRPARARKLDQTQVRHLRLRLVAAHLSSVGPQHAFGGLNEAREAVAEGSASWVTSALLEHRSSVVRDVGRGLTESPTGPMFDDAVASVIERRHPPMAFLFALEKAKGPDGGIDEAVLDEALGSECAVLTPMAPGLSARSLEQRTIALGIIAAARSAANGSEFVGEVQATSSDLDAYGGSTRGMKMSALANELLLVKISRKRTLEQIIGRLADAAMPAPGKSLIDLPEGT